MSHVVQRLAIASATAIALSSSAHASPIYDFTTIDVPGATVTIAEGIDDEGVVAGTFFEDGISQGFVRSVNGTITTFTIDGLSTVVGGINNLGQIAGNAGNSLAFIRNPDGSFITFPTIGSVFGINDSGAIVGYTSAQNDTVVNGYLRNPDGSITPINDPAGTRTVAQGINDLGQIVGNFDSQTQAFLLNTDGTFMNFTVPNANVQTAAEAINNLGDIAGFYDIASNQGFVRFADGTFETVDDPLGDLTQVLGINDSEELVGLYFDASGVEQGYLAVPEGLSVPEPSSLILLGFGLATLGTICRLYPSAKSPR